jgi:transposase
VREGGVTRSGRTEDPKVAALRETRCLNPHPEAVTDERFTSSDFFDARDLAQVKYEMVRAVREEDMPVTVAAAGFGLSRQSYYQAAAALDQGGLPGLVPAKPGPKGAHKLTEEVCAFAEDALATDPGLRPTDLCDAIERAFGVRVHARSVERALARRRARRSKSG